MSISAKNSNRSIIFLLLMMYVVVAMSDNFKGIFVPFFKQEFGVNNTSAGYILTSALFAYALFQYVGGMLIGRFGYKKVIVSGFVLGMAALLVLVNCTGFFMLIAGMFLLNAGMAMFNIGVNTLGPALTVGSTVVLMNLINFTYGVSNTGIQKASGYLLEHGIPWRSFYLIMLVLMAFLFVYAAVIKIPYTPPSEQGAWDKRELFSNPMLYFYIAICGFYLLSEFGIGNWFSNYMDEAFRLDADTRSLYVALFFGAETVGRLVGGFVVDRIGQFKSIILYGLAAAVISFTGILLGRRGLLLFSLAGFAFSIIYPTIIASIQRVFGKATSYATGFISMWATFLAMAGSMAIGLLNDSVGARYAFFTVAGSVMMTAVFAQLIRKKYAESFGAGQRG